MTKILDPMDLKWIITLDTISVGEVVFGNEPGELSNIRAMHVAAWH
jgi:hypothetical protein